jgi:mono/diheme cytochrome c family protein
MSKLRVGIVIAIVSALGVLTAGCGSDSNDAAAPASSTPAATETTAATETAAATETTPAAAAGDAANGKTLFEGKCQGCHAKGGTEAAVGPVLAGGGRDDARIRNQIINGGGPMPAGLYTGTDLDDVVAFVLSIQ